MEINKDKLAEWSEVIGSICLDYSEDHPIQKVWDELDQMQ